jgi:hypothetical protein
MLLFCTKFVDTMKNSNSRNTTSINGVISIPASRLAALERAMNYSYTSQTVGRLVHNSKVTRLLCCATFDSDLPS